MNYSGTERANLIQVTHSWVQESLRRKRVALIVNKSPKGSTCVQLQKQRNDFDSFLGKPFNITVIQGYAPTTDAKEAGVD